MGQAGEARVMIASVVTLGLCWLDLREKAHDDDTEERAEQA